MSITFDLATVWDMPRGTFAQPMKHTGYNNQLYTVEAGGEKLVLRVYGNHANPKFIQHELVVLAQLGRQHLPFAVPVPIITRRGEFSALVSDGSTRQLMVLIPFIAGANPIPNNLAQAAAAGTALGQLSKALSKVDTRGVPAPPSYNELGRVHPLISEPLEALREVKGLYDAAKLSRVQAALEQLVNESDKIFKRLPRQLTHSDFITGNILMENTTVTGILDFEYCAQNPRVTDLAVAFDMWMFDVLGTGDEWARVDAIGKPFCREVKLKDEEIAAIPHIILLRNAGVLMHVLGRFVAGTSPFIDVEMWLDSMLQIDAWLTLNSKKLVERVRGW